MANTPHISEEDTLNKGRVKLNTAIDDANIARDKSESADVKAGSALANSQSTQTQLDTIVIDGDSSVEAAQARVDEKGVPHTTLKARIDDGMNSVSSQLAQTVDNVITNSRPRGSERKCIVSFISDDGQDTDFTILKPFSEQYGVPFDMALCPGRPNQITDEHMQEALGLGWGFGSHSMNHHRLPTLTETELEYELGQSKREIQKQGAGCDYIVYPYNDHSDKVRKVARKHYMFGLAGSNKAVSYPAETYVITRISLGAYQGELPDTLEWYKEKFDEAYNSNSWIIFMLHASVPDFDATQRQHLADLIEYIQSKNVPIKNIVDAYNDMGNAFSVPVGSEYDGYVITNTGHVMGSETSKHSVQLGIDSTAIGLYSTGLGNQAKAKGNETVALGFQALAEGNLSIAIGRQSKSLGGASVALGNGATATAVNSIALGYGATTEGAQGTALGYGSKANGTESTALGFDAVASGNLSVAIGRKSQAIGGASVALGNTAKTNLANSIAIGYNATSNGAQGTAIGYDSLAEGTDSLAVGRGARAMGLRSVAIGANAIAELPDDFVLGTSSSRVIIKGAGVFLTSPGGTRYLLSVTDAGVVNVVQKP